MFASVLGSKIRRLDETVEVQGLSPSGLAATSIAQFRPDVRRVLMGASALALLCVPKMFWEPVMHWMFGVPNITIRQHTDVPPYARTDVVYPVLITMLNGESKSFIEYHLLTPNLSVICVPTPLLY